MKKGQPAFNTKTIVNFLGRLRTHAVTAYAAQSAFFIIISFFPFLMLLLTLLNYFAIPLGEAELLENGILPESVAGFLRNVLDEANVTSSGALISVTAISALWAASKGMLAVRRGMNSVYENTESRNYLIIRLYSLLETLVFIVLLLIILVIMVFGNTLYTWLAETNQVLAEIAARIIDLRGIAGMAVLIFFFDAMYVILPNRRGHFTKELPGAVLTAVGWIGFSYLYAYYVDNIANYASLYGSLTTIVLLMVWLYICMYMLFIGGEINSLLEETRFWDRLKKKKK